MGDSVVIAEKEYSLCFSEYVATDISIINDGVLGFSLLNFAESKKTGAEEVPKIRKKVVCFACAKQSSPRLGCRTIHQAGEIFVTRAGSEKAKALFVDTYGFVLSGDNDDIVEERTVADALGMTPQDTGILTAKTLHDAAYICGHGGLVACRTAPHTWRNLSLAAEQFPGPPLTLLDVDGFAPDDIYAIAWEAGVFHYNGTAWRRVPFPSNILLESLCCGGDGVVYVTGQGGTIFAGRGNVWKQAHEGHFTLPFMDAVWHQDALWCTSDYGVWTLEKGKFGKAPVPDEVYFCSGHLSARDDMLLIGGMNGAALCDGTGWQPLYFQPEIMAGLMDDDEGNDGDGNNGGGA